MGLSRFTFPRHSLVGSALMADQIYSEWHGRVRLPGTNEGKIIVSVIHYFSSQRVQPSQQNYEGNFVPKPAGVVHTFQKRPWVFFGFNH